MNMRNVMSVYLCACLMHVVLMHISLINMKWFCNMFRMHNFLQYAPVWKSLGGREDVHVNFFIMIYVH